MAAMTDYMEQQLGALVMNGVQETPALSGVWYLALFSGATSDALTSGGAAQAELTGLSGYARLQVVSGFSLSAGVATNVSALEYPAAGADWGTVSHVALFDALTSGNAWIHGALSGSKLVETGDVVRFASGQLAISFL